MQASTIQRPDLSFDPADWLFRWKAWGGTVIVHKDTAWFGRSLEGAEDVQLAAANAIMMKELQATPGAADAVKALVLPPPPKLH